MTKKNNTPINDPHAEREASKYDNPIPSREVILEVLREANKPLNNNKLCKKLQLTEHEQVDALRKRLRAMERDGQVMSNRRGAYGLVDKMNLVHCRVQGHRDGYGFAMPLKGGDDIYLGARQMHFVFDGDEVLVQVTGEDRRGRATVVLLRRSLRLVVREIGADDDEAADVDGVDEAHVVDVDRQLGVPDGLEDLQNLGSGGLGPQVVER